MNNTNNTTTELPLALTVVVYVVTSAVAVMAFVFAFAVVAIPFIKHKAFKKGEINERRRSSTVQTAGLRQHEQIEMEVLREPWKIAIEGQQTAIEDFKRYQQKAIHTVQLEFTNKTEELKRGQKTIIESIEDFKREQQKAIQTVQTDMKKAIAVVEAKVDNL